MSDLKISQLGPFSETDVVASDVLPLADVSAQQTKKIAASDLVKAGARLNADTITFGNNVVVTGNFTVNGTTTTIDTTTLRVEDKNIEMGVVATPTDVTANGGGITLKGTTDKTINWLDATDSWTSSENVDLASGKSYRINNTEVLNSTTLGSGVTSSSLTSVGTVTTGTWQGTTVATGYGGTGQTTYSNGQLLIGKTDGTLAKSTITAGSGVTVTNGDGAITIAATGSSGTVTNVTGTAPISVANGTTTPSISIAAASTSAAGAVQLTDSTSSTSTTTAATPNAVKSAYDLADAALPEAGGTMTGALGVTAGTAAAPGVFFSGDTNTGIYSPGADQVAISTGGSGRLFVDASGNVGVNTAPSARLHISDTDSSNAYTTGAILGTQTSIYKQIVHTNQSSGTNEAGIVLRAGTSGNIAEWGLSVQRTGATSGDLIFRTRTGASSSNEFVRITSGGLVGIGTSSASTNVEINAALDTGASLGLNEGQLSIGREANSGGAVRIGYDTTNNFGFISSGRVGTSWDRLILNAGGGNVGIGTSSVNRALEVNANNGTNNSILPALRLKTGSVAGALGYGTGLEFTLQASNNSEFVSAKLESSYTDATNFTGDLRFSTTNVGNNLAERLRIASTGALGLSGANYGSSGQVLTSQGSGAAPQWATPSGGLTLLSTITASAVNTVDFTSGFSSSYIDYFISIDNFSQNSGELHFFVSTDGGSSYVNTGYRNAGAVISQSSIFSQVNGQLKITSWTGVNSEGTFRISLYGAYATTRKLVVSDSAFNHSGSIVYGRYTTSVDTTSVVNAFRIKAEGTGNITGTFRLFGVTKI